MYAPIFNDESGNSFLLAYKDVMAETEEEAKDIGERIEDATGVQYGFLFSGNLQDMKTVRAVEGKLKDLAIVIVSGPVFDQVAKLGGGQ